MLVAAVAGCDAQQVSERTAPILGGSAVTAGQFPTVVALVVDQGRRGMCTGTLVAPDLVLTAAHCVDPNTLGYGSQSQVTAATIAVFDGRDLQSGQFGATRQASETIPHPGFRTPGDPDVGLVRLAQPINDRPPSPVNLSAALAPVGMSVTMVGFGVTENGGGGRNMYLEDKTSIACASYDVPDGTFLCFDQRDGEGKCSGDSGGPSFASINGRDDTVVGITSFGDQGCQYFGADMRTDASRTFFEQHAPELLCNGDGFCEEACDANGLPVDPDCSDCEVSDDCDGDEVCNDGFCEPAPMTPGGLGSSCEGGEQCIVGACAAGPDGMRCSDTCVVGNGDCPAGFECLSAGDSGACWPAADGGGGGGCRAAGGAASNGGAGGLGMLLLLALGWTVRRRRGG